jgi:cytidine deaminase
MIGENGAPKVAGVDWSRLRREAGAMTARSYAPYSGVRVGAAGLTEDGRLVVGCNVENASSGLGLCAECGLVSALHASGGGCLVAVSVVAGDGRPLPPCGRCRQLLYEAGRDSLLVDTANGPVALKRLLPEPFGPDDLATRRGPPGVTEP